MKKSILIVMAMLILDGVPGVANARRGAGDQPHGGGYYGDKYHIRKQGTPRKKLFRWDGYNSPIKGMKEAQKKPPSKYPSQSPDQ